MVYNGKNSVRRQCTVGERQNAGRLPFERGHGGQRGEGDETHADDLKDPGDQHLPPPCIRGPDQAMCRVRVSADLVEKLVWYNHGDATRTVRRAKPGLCGNGNASNTAAPVLRAKRSTTQR